MRRNGPSPATRKICYDIKEGILFTQTARISLPEAAGTLRSGLSYRSRCVYLEWGHLRSLGTLCRVQTSAFMQMGCPWTAGLFSSCLSGPSCCKWQPRLGMVTRRWGQTTSHCWQPRAWKVPAVERQVVLSCPRGELPPCPWEILASSLVCAGTGCRTPGR